MKRHRFDLLSGVFGLVYTVLGIRLLAGPVHLPDLDLDWIWPLAAVALGVALLVSARRSGGEAGREANDG
ncbi:MAG: hypothetical protein M3164_07280 [Actinomycetota bacterium]|nr:hypothetical protein [Actinomycetota bacterium]